MSEEMVAIPKSVYEGLVRSHKFLQCLEAEGVDNWDGYSRAYREAYPEDDEYDLN